MDSPLSIIYRDLITAQTALQDVAQAWRALGAVMTADHFSELADQLNPDLANLESMVHAELEG